MLSLWDNVVETLSFTYAFCVLFNTGCVAVVAKNVLVITVFGNSILGIAVWIVSK